MHYLSKKINHWFPKTPGIAARAKFECPQGDLKCRCAYEESGHPEHASLPDYKCKAPFCQHHHNGALYNDYVKDHFEAVKKYMQRHQNKHMIAAATNPGYKIIVILGEIDKRKLRILLDSGATGNHMNPDTAKSLQLKHHETTKWVNVISADGRPIMQGYRQETEPVLFKSGPYASTIAFDITPMSGYDAILGMPWLQEQNPVIDWVTGTVSIDNHILRTKLEECGKERVTNLQEGLGKTLVKEESRLKTDSSEKEPLKVKRVTMNEMKQENKKQQNRSQEQRISL
jgi:hypothetical protein